VLDRDNMTEVQIEDIKARKILDSRGNPTIEVDVELIDLNSSKTSSGRAAAPSGASRGVHEVVAFPNQDVDASVKGLGKAFSELEGFHLSSFTDIDEKMRELDGTDNLRNIGGNAVVALSMATAKALADMEGLPLFENLKEEAYQLPYPLGNVLGGGEHAGSTAPDIQEFLSLPVGAESFEEAVFGNAMVHKRVGEMAEEKDEFFTGGKSDEGAWAPNLSDEEALEIVSKACDEVSEELGFEIRAGLDVAASELYDSEKGKYIYDREGKELDTGDQIDLILDYIDEYDLIYVEDPIQEEDYDAFSQITEEAGDDCLICGDDLFVTNVSRIEQGMEVDASNSVLIKPNQIGTLNATKKAVDMTKENDCVPVISHRSGETTDETIAHLAVGWECPIIKTGAVGGERIAKLNELIRIEELLGEKAEMGEIN